MYKRILSGLAAFLMLFGTAAYLPADTFNSGIARASAYEFEFGIDDKDTPEGYTLFKQSELDLSLSEPKDWGGMEETEPFNYCNNWDNVDEMKEVYVRAVIQDIPEGVDVTKIYSTVFAMSGMDETEWNWKDSSNVYFKEDGSLEFHAKIDRETFSSYPDDNPIIHSFGLQFKLDPEAEDDYTQGQNVNVHIAFQVFTVGSGIEDVDPPAEEELLTGDIMDIHLTAPEYGSIGYDYELPVNSWDQFYSMRRVHVRARIEELDNDLDYSDLYAHIATMDSGYGNYCSSEQVIFDENGMVDFYVDTDDHVFFPSEGYEDELHFRLCIRLNENKYDLVSEETPRDVRISFEVLHDKQPNFFLGEEDMDFVMTRPENGEPVQLFHEFPIENWDDLYSNGVIHLHARIDELDEGLEYSDIVGFVATMNSEYGNFCMSEPVEFREDGSLDIDIPLDPEVFNSGDDESDQLHLRVYFELKDSALNKLPAEGSALARIHFRAETDKQEAGWFFLSEEDMYLDIEASDNDVSSHIFYEFPVNNWGEFYSFGAVHVTARIDELTEGLDSSDIVAYIATMNEEWGQFCMSEPVEFNDQGELELWVPLAPEDFYADESAGEGVHFRVYFQFKKSSENKLPAEGTANARIHFRAETERERRNDQHNDDDNNPHFNDNFDGAVAKLISGEPIDLLYDQYDDIGYFAEKKIFSADSWDDVYALGKACLQITRLSTMFTYSNDDPDFEVDFGKVRYALIARSADEGADPTVIEFDRNLDSIEDELIFTADAETLNPNGYESFEGLYVALIDSSITPEVVSEHDPEYNAGYRFVQLVDFTDLFQYEVADEESGSLRITGMNRDLGVTDLYIPFDINGANVTEIGDEAFKDMDLRNVEIRAFLEKIGDRAFEGNPKLRSLRINQNDCVLGKYSVGFNDDDTVNTNFLLQGEFESTAQTYAEENGIAFEGWAPWIDIGFRQKSLCQINENLYPENRTPDNSIAWMHDFDSDIFSNHPINWSEIEALRKIYLSAYIHRTCEDLDRSDFYAAFYTVDDKNNITVGTRFDFDEDGQISISEDVSKELFGVGENEDFTQVGVLFGLKDSSYNKTDLTDIRKYLASIQVSAEYSNSDYTGDPDFEFPDIDAELRDDVSTFSMTVTKNTEALGEYDNGRASFFTDWNYSSVYNEQYWAVQAYLTSLDNGIKPTDLILSIYCIDKDTGVLTDLYSVPFGEDGYAIVEGDIGYNVLKKNANATVGEFGYRIHAKDDAVEKLDDDMMLDAQFETRIFKKNIIPETEEGRLVKTVNNYGYPRISIFRGSYKSLKARKHLKITGSVDHIPEGLNADDLYVALLVRSSVDEGSFTETILRTTPDAEGKIVIETDITDAVFNHSPSQSKYIDIVLNTSEGFSPESYEGFDHVIFTYNLAFTNNNEIVTAGDYTIEVYEDGTASILEYNGTDTELFVPAELEGHKITGIGDKVFMDRGLTKVNIPEGITDIGANAFYDNKNLAEIVLPDSLEIIGGYAFSNTAITSLTVPENVTEIDEGAFCGCGSLTEVTLPDGVKEIGNFAFAMNPSLKSINIPTSLVFINYAVFMGTGLEEIAIPDNVQSIGGSAFADCKQLSKVTMSEDVYEIWDNAFEGCTSLKSFNIPDRLDQIRTEVFKDSGLTNIVIPARISSIASDAFRGCSDLENIVILNEEAAVSEKYYWDNEVSDDPIEAILGDGTATIRCYEGSAAETYAQTNALTFKAISNDDGGYDAPEYVWSADNSKVTATAYCYMDPANTVTETVDAAVKDVAPTCVKSGYTEYTAVFTSNKFTKQTKNIDGLPATGIHTEAEAVIENDDPATGEYDLVVYCTECGEEISRTHITPEVKTRQVGDINGDGRISADDAIIVARLAAGYGDYGTRYSSKVADINNDGKVTADDAIIIARFAAGYGDYSTRYYRTIPENEI